jgi:hypothetical protein
VRGDLKSSVALEHRDRGLVSDENGPFAKSSRDARSRTADGSQASRPGFSPFPFPVLPKETTGTGTGTLKKRDRRSSNVASGALS